MTDLSHLDHLGSAKMVDISSKANNAREATARGRIAMSAQALNAIKAGLLKKGDVLAVARVAGIMAAKKTSELIPLCHPLAISSVTVDFEFEDGAISAAATVRVSGQTGVEMEAITCVAVTLLTIYDMAKAIDKEMVISDIAVTAKSGGKSGDWHANK
jgi:cyclic pyranopterin monophosphate synthase